MINYRLRGLLTLHIVATAIVATGYFLVLALATRYFPVPQLNEDLNLLLYAAAIFSGLLLSGRYWRHLGARFHVIDWIGAAHITARQIFVISLLLFTLIVATKDSGISRLFLASYLATCSFVLLSFNRYLPGWLAKLAFHSAHQVPALFVGSTSAVNKLTSWLEQKEHLGVRVIGILTEDSGDGLAQAGAPVLGRPNELAAQIEAHSIGQVILLEIPEEKSQMLAIVEACQTAGCRLLVYHNLLDRMPVRLTAVIEDHHLFLTAQDEPLEDPFNRAIKRAFDLIIAVPVVAVLLPPLCAFVWIVQRIQAPGPLLFSRPRGGQRRQEFNMLKFRSMYAAAPNANQEARQARAGDARIYPFGLFLRKSSLDEFPQFWNVLTGDMSLVGPRPHLPKHDEEFSQVAKTYRTRHLVKPGITGLAQVSGFRGEITDSSLLEKRVQCDIEYIVSWSIWLDFQIVLRTALHVIRPPKTAR